MQAVDLLSGVLLVAGAAFFLAGTLGLLRFPDVYTRLHAIAKADNLGLGMIVLGLAVRADNVWIALKLLLVWLLMLVASAIVGTLIARRARQRGVRPWVRDRT